MAEHELKLLKEYADAKAEGVKSFELREDDRGYAVGDKVRYRVVDELGNESRHGLSGKEFEIVYVLRGFTRGLKRNWVIWEERETTVEGESGLSPQSPAATAPLGSQGEPSGDVAVDSQGEPSGDVAVDSQGEPSGGKGKAKKKG